MQQGEQKRARVWPALSTCERGQQARGEAIPFQRCVQHSSSAEQPASVRAAVRPVWERKSRGARAPVPGAHGPAPLVLSSSHLLSHRTVTCSTRHHVERFCDCHRVGAASRRRPSHQAFKAPRKLWVVTLGQLKHTGLLKAARPRRTLRGLVQVRSAPPHQAQRPFGPDVEGPWWPARTPNESRFHMCADR